MANECIYNRSLKLPPAQHPRDDGIAIWILGNRLALKRFKHPTATALPFVTFPDSFAQTKETGKQARRVAVAPVSRSRCLFARGDHYGVQNPRGHTFHSAHIPAGTPYRNSPPTRLTPPADLLASPLGLATGIHFASENPAGRLQT